MADVKLSDDFIEFATKPGMGMDMGEMVFCVTVKSKRNETIAAYKDMARALTAQVSADDEALDQATMDVAGARLKLGREVFVDIDGGIDKIFGMSRDMGIEMLMHQGVGRAESKMLLHLAKGKQLLVPANQ